MPFCVVYGIDLDENNDFNKLGDFYIKGLNDNSDKQSIINIDDGGVVIKKGDIFNGLSNQFIKSDWEFTDKDQLSNLFGVFSLVKIDFRNYNVNFITSRLSCEPLFRYAKDNVFVITDNFWEVIALIKPNFEDINQQAFFETLIHYYPMLDETIISGLNIVLPSTKGKFGATSKTLKVEKYWSINYRTQEKYSIDEAVDSLDRVLDNAMKILKEKLGDKKFAVGLSGGLDSRIIPYYAQKNNMDIESFIIGESKPNKIFLSRDHKSSRELAKYYKLKHSEYEYNQLPLEQQFILDLKKFPTGSSQLFKIPPIEDLDFDILITGGNGGVLVGASVPDKIESKEPEDLVQSIMNHIRIINNQNYYKIRIAQVLKHILNIDYYPKQKNITWVEDINPKRNINALQNKFLEFIKRNDELSNLSIYQEYNAQLIGFRSKMGSFEGMLGYKTSYSIWSPFIIDESMKWPIEFIENRMILKELIKRKIPGISDIRTQTYKVELSLKKPTKFRKVVSLIDFMIRGAGTVKMDRWIKKKDFIHLYNKNMTNDCEWFYRILPVKQHIQGISINQHRLAVTMLKLKGIIDIIEQKKYDDMIKEGGE